MKQNPVKTEGREAGTIMLAAVGIVFALASLTLWMAAAVRAELAGAAHGVASRQVEQAARGALRLALAELAANPESRPLSYASPLRVGNVELWMLPPGSPEPDDYDEFAMRDEGSRLNINLVDLDVLRALPGMTEEAAAAIVAWRGSGAEVGGIDEYLLLPEPYRRKQGPFETLDELLWVKGVSPELLYGAAAAETAFAADFGDGRIRTSASSAYPADNGLGHGWFDYITVYSRPPAIAPAGAGQEEAGRIEVNRASRRQLQELLQSVVESDQLNGMVDQVRAEQPFENLVDFFYSTGLTANDFNRIAGRVTVGSSRAPGGALNVNTAPRHVLLCLPGIGEIEADALLARRRADDHDPGTIVWIAEVLPRETAVAIANLLAPESRQYSFDILAVDDDGRAFRGFSAVVDASASPPRVIYWKDISYKASADFAARVGR